MVFEMDIESLLLNLKKNIELLPTKARKYYDRLAATPFQRTQTCVYTILHHIVEGLENIVSIEEFFEALTLSMNCLVFLQAATGKIDAISDIPKNGIDKLLYKIISQAEKRKSAKMVNEFTEIFLQRTTVLECPKQIAYYASLRMMNLKVMDKKCSCHTGECLSILHLCCHMNGFVTSLIANHNPFSFQKFFATCLNLCIPHITSNYCLCHVINVSVEVLAITKQLKQYQVQLCETTRTEVKLAAKFVHLFLSLFGILASDGSNCTKFHHQEVSEIFEKLLGISERMATFIKGYGEIEQSAISQVATKFFFEILKNLIKAVDTSRIEWLSTIISISKLCNIKLFHKEKKLNPDILAKLIYFYYVFLQSHEDKETRIFAFESVNKLMGQNAVAITQLPTTNMDHCVDCIINICIAVSNCNNTEESGKCLPIALNVFALSCEQGFLPKVFLSGTVLCRMLCHLGDNERAMEVSAKAASLLWSHDTNKCRNMVETWWRSKFRIMSKNKELVETQTIADYFKKDLPITSVIKVMFVEWEVCKQYRQHPPVSEFQVLCKIVSIAQPETVEAVTASTLLSVLLHSWRGTFQYPSDSSSLCNNVVKALKHVETKWEIAFLAKFTSFICSWESNLSKIWNEVDERLTNDSEPNYLTWSPSVSPLHCKDIIDLVLECKTGASKRPIYPEYTLEVVASLRILAIYLCLREEFVESLRTHQLIVRLLQTTIDIDKDNNVPVLLLHLILTHCSISTLSAKCGLYSAALTWATQAKDLAEKFERCVTKCKERSERISKLNNQATISAGMCLAEALLNNGMIDKASEALNDVIGHGFIDTKSRSSSHVASFLGAQADLVRSRLCVALAAQRPHDGRREFVVYEAAQTQKVACMLLSQAMPGVFKMLKIYDFSIAGKSLTVPKFGRKSKDSNNDMLKEFELLYVLLESTYNLANLWVLAGDLRFASLYNTDGILICRLLQLPERELQFQSLMAQLTWKERNNPRVTEELVICQELLSYVASTASKTNYKRQKLFSTANLKDDSELRDAINNSSVMEELDDDVIDVSSIDTDVTTSKLMLDRCDVMASPQLAKNKRRRLSPDKGHKNMFLHNAPCSCKLCRNFSLYRSQCSLAVLHAEYLEATCTAAEAVSVLERTRSQIAELSFKFKQHLLQLTAADSADSKADLDPKCLLAEELKVISKLSQVYFKIGDHKSSKHFVKIALQKLSSMSLPVDFYSVLAQIHLTAGLLLLKKIKSPKTDISVHLNHVIDAISCSKSGSKGDLENAKSLSKKMSLLNLEKTAEDKSNGMVTPNINTSITKTPSVSSNQIAAFQTPARSRPKQKLQSQTKSTLESTYRTPHVKRLPSSKQTSARPSITKSSKSRKKLNAFEIFNDQEDTPVIDLTESKPATRKKLPVPDLADSDNQLLSPTVFATPAAAKSTSTTRTRRTRTKITWSSDEDNDEDYVPDVKPKSMGVRKSSRATRSASRNIMKSRKEAKKKHREEEGLVYTDEEKEAERPTRKKTTRQRVAVAKEIVKSSDQGSDPDEVETNRDIAMEKSPQTIAHPRNYSFIGALNDEPNVELWDCESHLKNAFKYATASGDFHVSKLAAQHLAIHHHRSCLPSRDLSSANSHALSVGVSLRSIFNYLCKVRMASGERHKEQLSQVNFDALKFIDRSTNPSYVIGSLDNEQRLLNDTCSNLPPDWSVCILSHVSEGTSSQLLVTKLRHSQPVVHLQIDAPYFDDVTSRYDNLLKSNVISMNSKDKSLWWTQRRDVNRAFGQFVVEMEVKLLGEHRGVMLGCLSTDVKRNQMKQSVSMIAKLLNAIRKKPCDESLIEVYLSGWSHISVEEKTVAACKLTDSISSKYVIDTVLEFERQSRKFESESRGHVILVLDKRLQALPWEGISLLRERSVSRLPSLDVLNWQLRLARCQKYAETDPREAAYIVNAGGDLTKTANRFSDWFTSIKSWEGIVSRVPTKQEWLDFITGKSLFIYSGHGSGAKYVARENLVRKHARACVLLMGCSSGRLFEEGTIEPEGPAISYLLSGSACVLSCLWPVTDKDIDQYLTKCLYDWLKTDKCLTDVVRGAERVCKIPNINGMGCVVYGIPVRCTRTVPQFYDNLPPAFRDAAHMLR